jgi:hypothetical protein
VPGTRGFARCSSKRRCSRSAHASRRLYLTTDRSYPPTPVPFNLAVLPWAVMRRAGAVLIAIGALWLSMLLRSRTTVSARSGTGAPLCFSRRARSAWACGDDRDDAPQTDGRARLTSSAGSRLAAVTSLPWS